LILITIGYTDVLTKTTIGLLSTDDLDERIEDKLVDYLDELILDSKRGFSFFDLEAGK
jgi:hypothetical protein